MQLLSLSLTLSLTHTLRLSASLPLAFLLLSLPLTFPPSPSFLYSLFIFHSLFPGTAVGRTSFSLLFVGEQGCYKDAFDRSTTQGLDNHGDIKDKNRGRLTLPLSSPSSPPHTPTPLPSCPNPSLPSPSPPSSSSWSCLPTTPLALSTSPSPSCAYSSPPPSLSPCSSPSSNSFSPTSPTPTPPPWATTTTQQMKTRSRTPSPSSYNNTRNDNEGTLDIDHNNTTTTSRHYSQTNTSLPSMPAFLSPLKSGTGVPAAAETIIAGDYGQPVWQEEVGEQVIMHTGSTGEDLELAAIAPLDDVAQEKSESLSPLSEKATHISFSQKEPSYSYTYTVISEQDDGHSPEQEEPEQLQHQQKELTANTAEYLSTTIKEPILTSLYPKGFLRQKPSSSSTGILSPPTQSIASSMADLSNNSSASITANMLAIKSHVFVQQDHQQPRLMPVVVVPIYQLSTPISSTNSLSSPSRSASPVHHHHHHPPFAKVSTPLSAQLGTTLETTPTSDSSITQRLSIPTIAKDEIRPGPTASVKFNIANSRSGKGHSSNSSSCSWTSSLAPPSVDEMDPGKDLSGASPSPAAPLPAAAPAPASQRSQQHPTHHHDHSLSSVLDDLKCKTQNVLRKAGFSIAPEAGLFADRGSTKPADLKVIRLFPGSAAFLSRTNGGDRHGHMITESKNSTSGSVSVSGVAASSTAKSTGFFGRPRSRSVRETSRPSLEVDAVLAQQQLQQKQQPQTPDTTTTGVLTTSPTSIDNPPSSPPRPASSSSSSSMSVFKFERWPPWGGGHQRASSGPARPSDWTIRPKRRMTVGLEHAHIVPNGSDRILDQHTSSSSLSGGGGDHVRTTSGPLPPLPPLPTTLASATIAEERVTAEERKKKKGHQRRVSDATTLTMASARSAGASPQRFQLQHLQQQQQHCLPPSGTGLVQQQQTIPEKLPTPSPSKSMMGNWFGMVSKRRSFPSVEEEDPKRRFGYGGQQFHGFELAGVGSQRNSMIILDDEDEDLDDLDEDSDLDEDEHATAATGEEGGGGRATPVGRVRKGRRRQVLVNNYGFICEPDENGCSGGGGGDANQLHPSGELPSGSMVSELAARLSEPGSFLAEHERKRNLKKQYEFNRVSEVKWIQAMNQLQPDQVKKLTKVKTRLFCLNYFFC